MFDHIADYALKNVWCTPGQDAQAILKMPRLSPRMGIWNKIEVMRVVYSLPEKNVRFHVFTLSQLNPLILGLTSVDREWVSFADACTNETLIADLYVASGLQFPRHQCWYYVTEDKNVLVAVKEQTRIPVDLGVEDLFIRVYSNAYFNTDRADGAYDYVKVVGKTVKTTDDILDLQNKFNDLKQKPGLVYAFVNGYHVSGIDLFTTQLGDVVEYVFDGSVYRVLDFPINELNAYTSEIDSKQKFLLHSPEGSDTIDFEDDIDVFLYSPAANNRFKALYFHRNKEDALRNVTHADYGLAIPYVEAMAATQGWEDINELRVRLHVRKAGWKRPLVFEANRIKELYKMSSEDVLKAMVGVDSTVSPWRAEKLEGSAYCAVMRFRGSVTVNSTDLPKEMVQDCFGYNSLAKYLGDTPVRPYESSDQMIAAVPVGLQVSSTAYEYDTNGYLIDWYNHIQGSAYPLRNPDAKLVEMIGGKAGRRLDEFYGLAAVPYDPAVDYRMYLCKIESGRPNNNWEDVTGSDKYSIAGGAVVWHVDLTRWYPMVRGNRNFLAYSIELMADFGRLKFSLTTEQVREGTVQDYVMQIPMGELDLWLNKRHLTEGLDYIVKFPEIVIINKKYLDDPMNKPQRIDVRFTGFCKSDFTREKIADTGFINHGLLSNNDRFDLRDDRVQMIVVDGALRHRDELKFAETDTGVTVPDASNGAPYMIRDIIVQMRGLVKDSTYTLREKAQLVDKEVTDYLSMRLPGPTFENPSAIPQLYPVYSPFLSYILFGLLRGVVDPTNKIRQHYNDADVYTLCREFENLLPYDPTQEGNELSSDYVAIHPHHLNVVVEVDLYQYRFLLRVIKLYLKDKVSLTNFVSIST